MNKDVINSYIPFAQVIADKLDRNRFRHVSIIIDRNGKLRSIGTNEKKTHPTIRKLGYRAEEMHSEFAAYLGIRWKAPKRMILINFRFNNRLELLLSKPCKFCLPWVAETFEEVWYSGNDGEMIRCVL